ncbi:MBL fold metallo-hydrolase [Photobacterium sagamiensis]|uniref:MBL fold metallo-hydrolase n=1 Tax=Photobacterium sagamiensis TaxID=2910241 RepID=UPI003D0A38A5
MFTKQKSKLLGVTMLVLMMSVVTVQAKTLDTLNNEKIADNISMVKAGGVKIYTFHGVSNSHIIETKNELRVIDAQLTLSSAKKLKAFIESLNKPLVEVLLSHNHPDHWFGSEIFASKTPIATISSVKADLARGGMRYIKIKNKNLKMKGDIPTQVIFPNKEIKLGVQKWDGLTVVVEEYDGHEAHHSMLIKIPSMGVIIGQDLFYNNMFLVASNRERNKKWRALLQDFSVDEAMYYKTLLVGHGENGDPSILKQDIEYLDELENILSNKLSLEETKKYLLKKFPNKGGKGMLEMSMKNLYSGH